jgi:hypothetical protein
MRNRQEILRAHYAGLLKRFGTWAGLAALVLGVLVPSTSMAAQPGVQMGARSLTLSTSAASASNVTYSFSFVAGSSATIKGIKFQLCDSPLELVACNQPDSATFAGSSLSSVGGDLAATWTPSISTNTDTLSKAAGDSVTTGHTLTVVFTNVTNPTVSNKTFYARVTTYISDTTFTAGNESDFGAMAVSTANQITTTANVQESLTFCVGTSGTTCSGGSPISGSAVTLGTTAANVLSSSTPSGGQSVMYADTNAATGYSITYLAANLASASDTITAAGAGSGTGTAFSAGTAMFGINLSSGNTITGTTSGGISGSGSAQAQNANYTNNDKVAFVPNAATAVANSNSLPTLGNLYKVSYIAQAGSTSKPGAYSTTFTYVATGTF